MLHDSASQRRMRDVFRPRSSNGTWSRLIEALIALGQGEAELVRHTERVWASATFSGSRHSVVLVFRGLSGLDVADVFIEALPEHEFAIPGQLVADASVVEAKITMLPEPCFEVEVEMLLLEDR